MFSSQTMLVILMPGTFKCSREYRSSHLKFCRSLIPCCGVLPSPSSRRRCHPGPRGTGPASGERSSRRHSARSCGRRRDPACRPDESDSLSE